MRLADVIAYAEAKGQAIPLAELREALKVESTRMCAACYRRSACYARDAVTPCYAACAYVNSLVYARSRHGTARAILWNHEARTSRPKVQ